MVSTRKSPNAKGSSSKGGSSKESASERTARRVWGSTAKIRDAPQPPPSPPYSPGSSTRDTRSPVRRSPRLASRINQPRLLNAEAFSTSTASESAASSDWKQRARALQEEEDALRRIAPRLYNEMNRDKHGDINEVEGTQLPATHIDFGSPSNSEESSGLDILSQVAGVTREDELEGEELSQELL
eukprot:CAMPEP_0194325236 /NCGR_PEP_ID=MMETSP0171-20130528/29121_1 /TAXON_ID=218684 /ORGANISM="Corethron pennatum, Strain L29A3" /LENGTH=184 /DNA_ID=CAMNT_0039084287 /DNA_START=54 /DNA_END=609 /DNA_ORIENTATION=+